MIYSIGFFIFSLLYLPVLIFKGKLHAEFGERFAIYERAKKNLLVSAKARIWIQAVSVGEVALCKSLMPLLKERFPANEIVISTITKTGNDLARKLFSNDAIIIYFPLDFRFIVRKCIKLVRPRLFVMVETEIWPNLLKELAAESIPSILINGRISDRSIGKYRLAKPFLKNILNKINAYCMQDKIDAERIIELGAPADRVNVSGNMKFDVNIMAGKNEQDIYRSLGLNDDDELLVAGSTHDGEEKPIAEAYEELLKEFPNLKLLIAPRHIDRVNEIEMVLKKLGLELVRISKLFERRTTSDERRILILDTIGHLSDAYSVATLVFIGGSLVKHGGQNPIEPAIFEKPIMFGPYMFNFKYISETLVEGRGAIQISDKKDLIEACRMLLKDVHAREALGKNAKRIVDENRGATERNIEAIKRILK